MKSNVNMLFSTGKNLKQAGHLILGLSLLLLTVVASPKNAHAAEEKSPENAVKKEVGAKPGSFIFGAQFGKHFFEDGQAIGSNELRDRPSLNLRIGYALIDHLDIDFVFKYVGSRIGVTDADLYTFHGGVTGNLFSRHVWTPYASFGVGSYSIDVRSLSITEHDVSISYAAGVKWFFYQHVAFIAEARGITVFDIDETNLELTAGLIVYADLFRKQRDTDNDGIKDGIDKCPNVAEDKDGFKDGDGCPEKDNDNDNIDDDKDRCPLKPEDLDGFEDADGCPDADNDKDGIKDADDKCPNQPEDTDSFKDDDGCPDADNDADGIADADDKCPNQAETKNGFADDDGCPDRVLDKFSGIIRDIRFAVNSSLIAPTSYAVLDETAAAMKTTDGASLTIEGHTDSTGNSDYNLKLSRLRAEAVRQYLISKGVSPEQIVVAAYGDQRPIASNNTTTGRALNRRIEFKFQVPTDN